MGNTLQKVPFGKVKAWYKRIYSAFISLYCSFLFIMPTVFAAGDSADTGSETANSFLNTAVDVLSILVIAIGAGLGVWGVVNLLEGYGNDNPGAKSQGIKQLMGGLGVILVGAFLIPMLKGLFTQPTS